MNYCLRSSYLNFLLLLFLLFTPPVFAQSLPPSNAVDVVGAMKLLKQQGYYDVSKIKLEKKTGKVTIEARNSEGKKMILDVDLHSGAMTEQPKLTQK